MAGYSTKQYWINNGSRRLFGVLRTPDNYHHFGIVFFHGFGQNKSGSYFIFSQIAKRVACVIPCLQFDYYGWGDSEGESYESTYDGIVNDGYKAIQFLISTTGCTNVVLVGSGFGNWVAADLGKRLRDSSLIMLSPWVEILYNNRDFHSIYLNINSHKIIDTATLDGWFDGSTSLFFEYLGEGLNRSKGIQINSDFLLDLAKIDPQKKLLGFEGEVLEFHSKYSSPLNAVPSQVNIPLPKSDFRLLHPLDRSCIVDSILNWLMNLKG